MMDVVGWLRSFAEATVDVGLSTFGLLFVLVPTVGALTDLTGTPVEGQAVELAFLVAVLALAYPFANRLLSQGWLETYVLAFWVGIVGFGIAGGVVVAGTGISLSGENPLWPALLIAQGHAAALTIVYLDDVQLRYPPHRVRGEAQ